MSIDEKVSKTLEELGIRDVEGVTALFAAVRTALQEEGEWPPSSVFSPPDVLKIRWLSRKNGLLAHIDHNWLKPAPKHLKPNVGHEFNQLKRKVVERFGELADTTEGKGFRFPSRGAKTDDGPDLTLPGNRRPVGSIHPLTRVQRELEEIFLGLGFSIETGPEVESVYYNFDALNMPENHPARDDMDSLYVDSKTVLRTHTSPVQIRAMKKRGAPLYIIVPGRVYRRDNPDATHSPMFHQIEGLAVDADITFADLKGTLDFFAKKFFGEKIRTSFFPSFFPFTEPSGDLAISCVFCDGQGCRVCKESGWVEVMGCGMVHPQVLRNGGVDPERYCGWAFGLGVDRFALMKYGINDIQLLFQNDLRFLEQF